MLQLAALNLYSLLHCSVVSLPQVHTQAALLLSLSEAGAWELAFRLYGAPGCILTTAQHSTAPHAHHIWLLPSLLLLLLLLLLL